jgi:hypothetical protein
VKSRLRGRPERTKRPANCSHGSVGRTRASPAHAASPDHARHACQSARPPLATSQPLIAKSCFSVTNVRHSLTYSWTAGLYSVCCKGSSGQVQQLFLAIDEEVFVIRSGGVPPRSRAADQCARLGNALQSTTKIDVPASRRMGHGLLGVDCLAYGRLGGAASR